MYVLYRNFARAGRLDDAEVAIRRFRSMSDGGDYSQGLLELQKGNAAVALTIFEREAQNDYIRSAARAMALFDLGRLDEYEAAVADQIENWGEEAPVEVARVYGWVGDSDAAFEWLEKAYGPNVDGFFREIFRPYWTKLHDDPRWLALREKSGFSAERIAAIEFDIELPD